jgi:hypothetical protein
MSRKKNFALLMILSFCFPLILFCQQNASDSKATAVDAFMNARMLEHNVSARNLMTARLENNYLRGKKLSVRVKAGRIISYNFDPSTLGAGDRKEFEVEVQSTWADLNEQVFDTQQEKIKFIWLKNEWMADSIDLLNKVPTPGLPPMDLENAKRVKFAVAMAKKFAKAIINRNISSLLQVTSQEYQKRFSNAQNMIDTLGSRQPLTYSAFGLKDYSVRNPEQINFTLVFYQVAKGRRGHTLVEARVTTRQGSLDWEVEECQFNRSAQ